MHRHHGHPNGCPVSPIYYTLKFYLIYVLVYHSLTGSIPMRTMLSLDGDASTAHPGPHTRNSYLSIINLGDLPVRAGVGAVVGLSPHCVFGTDPTPDCRHTKRSVDQPFSRRVAVNTDFKHDFDFCRVRNNTNICYTKNFTIDCLRKCFDSFLPLSLSLSQCIRRRRLLQDMFRLFSAILFSMYSRFK